MEEEPIQTKKSPSPDITKTWVFLDATDVNSEDESKKQNESDSDSISIISEGGFSINSKSDEEETEIVKADENPEIEEKIVEVHNFTNLEDVELVRPISDIFENIQSNNSFITDKYVKKCSGFISNAFIVLVIAVILIKLEYFWFGSRYSKNTIKTDDYNLDLFQQQYEIPQSKLNCKYGQYFDMDGNEHCHKKNKKYNKKNDKAIIFNNKPADLIVKPIIENSIKTHNYIINTETNNTVIEKIDKNKSNNNKQFENKHNKNLKELKMKEEYLKQKEKLLIEKEHDLLKRELKIKEQENKVKKKSGKKGDDFEFNKQDKNKKRKFDKTKDFVYKTKNSSKDKFKQDKKQYSKIDKPKKIVDKKNMTGDWYYKLHQGRNNFRKKEQTSDWLFERAKLRSLKRNKAYWYFQWMFDRERLRSA